MMPVRQISTGLPPCVRIHQYRLIVCTSWLITTTLFIARKCGTVAAGSKYTSLSNRLVLEFCTDDSVQRMGFKISWRAIAEAGRHVWTLYLVDMVVVANGGSSGTIASDNYPMNYLPNTSKRWVIAVNRGLVRMLFIWSLWGGKVVGIERMLLIRCEHSIEMMCSVQTRMPWIEYWVVRDFPTCIFTGSEILTYCEFVTVLSVILGN